MIVGLFFIGSILGWVAAVIALLAGQSAGSAAMIYMATGVLSILAISLGCAFRPRKTLSRGT